MTTATQLKTYELINPSDPYTFKAPNIEVAGLAAAFLSTHYGAKSIDGSEQSPIMFGWDEWMKENGIDDAWIEQHKAEIAEALDSFLIGDVSARDDVEEMLAMMPKKKCDGWKKNRQHRKRTSMNMIGERAYELAKALKEQLL